MTRGSVSRGSSAEAPHSTPELQYSASYESSPRSAPVTPPTPTEQYNYYHQRHPCDYQSYPYGSATQMAYPEPGPHQMHRRESSFSDATGPIRYSDDSAPAATAPERAPKRYPCRYRDTHNCDKTFTTSGHASRHSKIHTAEKGVPCTHPGCTKKFTRADNMKQHLETHTKDKSKSRGKAASSPSRRQTQHHSRRSSTHRPRPAPPPLDVVDRYGAPMQAAPPPASPATGAWDFGSFREPLMTPHNPHQGLDVLAMAAHQQMG